MGYEKFGPEDRQVTLTGHNAVPSVEAPTGDKVDSKVDVTDSKGKGLDPVVFAGLQNQRSRVRSLLLKF